MTTTKGSWFERIPKVEIHIHLEGAIPLDAMWSLLEKYGGDPEVTSFEALQRRFAYRDFAEFIATWSWKNGFLREYEDFTVISAAVARHLAEQNVRYAEMFYSPSLFTRHGLSTQRLTEAIRRGLAQEARIEVALVADLVRDFGPERESRTLAELREVKALGVIGIGIGGSEHEFPPEPFASMFEQARHAGFHTTAHAGEAAGPASVRAAVEVLQVERIGHATRAGEDPTLLTMLAERQIPLEMCPVSNVRTGIVPGIAQHPIRRYFDRGLRVTVNTDDPAMFGTSLAGELRALHDDLGFRGDELKRILVGTIEATWMDDDRKRAYAASLLVDPAFADEP